MRLTLLLSLYYNGAIYALASLQLIHGLDHALVRLLHCLQLLCNKILAIWYFLLCFLLSLLLFWLRTTCCNTGLLTSTTNNQRSAYAGLNALNTLIHLEMGYLPYTSFN